MKYRFGFPSVSLLMLIAGLALLTAAPQSALAQDEPAISKRSIEFDALEGSIAEKAPNMWRPSVVFWVNPPVHDASVVWVEVGFPGSKQRTRVNCGAAFGEQGLHAQCGFTKTYVATTGLVDFSIHLSNELLGTNTTLFTGKAKVAKSVSGGNVDFHAIEDWRLPIGYIYFQRDSFRAEMSFRGYSDPSGNAQAYLFYQGKELSRGEGAGARRIPEKYGDANVHMLAWYFPGAGRTPEVPGTGQSRHAIPENPGEYEIKVMRGGRLARSLKFTVAEDGSFDNGIATDNKLGSEMTIVPVKILGDTDGVWDKLAWKTGAFYGNPLTGFTAPP